MNKKIILAGGVILVFLAYVGYQKAHSAATSDTTGGTSVSVGTDTGNGTSQTPSQGGTTSAGSESINPNAGGSGSAGAGTTVTSTGTYKDGTYTGTVADAIYGPLQVKAIVSGGKLTDVQFLQYPNSSGHTSEVSARALPQLKSMAIAAQSSKVDAISGATQTREAFEQSLASALAQAK
jgi:uncharacterized protein with FMN-binding domain